MKQAWHFFIHDKKKKRVYQYAAVSDSFIKAMRLSEKAINPQRFQIKAYLSFDKRFADFEDGLYLRVFRTCRYEKVEG